MYIIIISPSKTIENEIKIVTELFEHGLQTFHLRKPTMSTKEMRQYLDNIPVHFHDRIVIHSHHHLLKKYSLKGIHLTRQHLKRKFYSALRVRFLQMRRPGIIISTSFHKVAALYENKKKYDYVFLGTIFDVVSDKFNAGYSAHSLSAALVKSVVPAVARGGTHSGNVGICHELGFKGIVFYSGIWKKENPVEEFCKILEQCKALNLKTA
ncbi:thiamine phosphate synthase [soil metagenome]